MRNEKQTEGAEIVYNPPFKKEARKKTAEILQATQGNTEAEEGKAEEAVKQQLSFDWNLDGFPSYKPKKTEDVNFNWESVLEKKTRSRGAEAPTVEKLTAADEEFSWEKEFARSRSVLSQVWDEKKDEAEDILSNEAFVKASIDNYNVENDNTATKRYIKLGGKESRDEQAHSLNSQNDEFRELLEREKERVRNLEDEYNRQLVEMDFTWVPDIFPHKSESRPESRVVDIVQPKAAQCVDLSDSLSVDEKQDKVEKAERTAEAPQEAPQTEAPKPEAAREEATQMRPKDLEKDFAAVFEQESLPMELHKEKLRYSDIFPRVDEELAEGDYVPVPSDFEFDEEDAPRKNHIFTRIVIAVLTVVLALESVLLAVRIVAPESKLALAIGDALVKIVEIFTGDEQQAGMASVDYEPRDAYISSLVADAATKANYIGTIIYNATLTYPTDRELSFKELASADEFVDAQWEEADATYGEKLAEAVIRYYDSWIDSNHSPELVGINTLEIGEIRTGAKGFYVLCKLDYAKENGDEFSQCQTVFAKISNGLMVINEIKEETL